MPTGAAVVGRVAARRGVRAMVRDGAAVPIAYIIIWFNVTFDFT